MFPSPENGRCSGNVTRDGRKNCKRRRNYHNLRSFIYNERLGTTLRRSRAPEKSCGRRYDESLIKLRNSRNKENYSHDYARTCFLWVWEF